VPRQIDIVFDGPPGPEPACLVEIEDADGHSIEVGEWTIARNGKKLCGRLIPEFFATSVVQEW
jgi:hypothetical protein